jgi:hypothetical protein
MGALVKLGLSFFGGKTWLLIAAAIAALYVGFLHLSIANLKAERARLQSDLSIARANLATAVDTNKTNVAALDRLRVDDAARRTAFAVDRRQTEARCNDRVEIRKEIARVAETDPAQCGVAPSVRRALERLQPAP